MVRSLSPFLHQSDLESALLHRLLPASQPVLTGGTKYVCGHVISPCQPGAASARSVCDE
jgi:hypothetical protein